MSDDSTDLPATPGEGPNEGAVGEAGHLIDLPIEDELKESYLTYAMSVIVSRALPDARDGLKPSQRRILVAMNDLNLTPGAARAKCAKIAGETMGNYHPHGQEVIYPTLVRLAQEWNIRYPLVDKQGNFGSIAGLPPAAMRYTEARMSSIASLMLEDINRDTVDFVPTYDESRMEPSVLPARFPNLLVNGASGIAVGMSTSLPPHNLGEVCQAVVEIIDNPDISVDELLEIIPGPDFPTGGIICGRSGIRRGYHTGRSTIVLRARAYIEEHGRRNRIVVTEIPYQQARDRIEERIAALVNDGRIVGIAGIRNESDLKEPVRLVLDLKRDAEPDVVLNQLYQFSPLQESFSLIFLALVDGKPQVLSIKSLLDEFLRHRVLVIRRRTQFLLSRARNRKHTVEGLLLAYANIDEVIHVIRSSSTQAEAKERLMQITCPAPLVQRALGDEGFAIFQEDCGQAEAYSLSPIQADAILRMTLGQLVNLEQEKLTGEHHQLLEHIAEYQSILADEKRIYAMVREDMLDLKRKYGDKRRTEISGEEIGNIDLEDLITEEPMVVTITHNGYIKRTAASTYRAQRRGGKGLTGAKADLEDPIEHFFVASTHAFLLFFTNHGKVYWQKVYDLPQLSRESKGRAIVNLLHLDEGEQIADCRAVRDFDKPGHFLFMATRNGMIKKTSLEQYSRPLRSGIIAIKLRDDDELVDVVVTKPGDEVVLATARGMAIRFKESDARPTGRNTSGVKGIRLSPGDQLVGMVVTDPDATLLTACLNGYGKRTPFGPNLLDTEVDPTSPETTDEISDEASDETGDETGDETASGQRYRTQRRGGKGIRDIKTTARNGPVVGIVRVGDDDELMMVTARGKLQRVLAAEIGVISRNTQGVRIMRMDRGDTLAAVVRVLRDINGGAETAVGSEPIATEPGTELPDETPENGAPEDHAAEHGTPEDIAPEDIAPEDKDPPQAE